MAFWTVTAAYLAVTVAESVLAPTLPLLATDLGFDLSLAGVALGTLTGATALGNLVGGYLLARAGSRVALVSGLALSAAGCVLVGLSAGVGTLVAGQAVIGFGVGAFFPAGLQAAGHHAGRRRRGLAMGLFGVAFSGGLTIAALLAATGARLEWRLTFFAAAALCGLAVLAVLPVPLPSRPGGPPGGQRRPLHDAFGPAVAAGGIGAVCQYGTIAFLPTFAVLMWGLSPGGAALLLAGGRILSVPAKLLAGGAADRFGAKRTLTGLGVVLTASGLVWCLLPPGPFVVAAALLFTGAVSAVFPIANLLALDEFGDRGPLIGTFRSTQLAVGAGAAWLLGTLSARVGLTPVLTATVLVPLGLFLLDPGRKRGARARPEA